MDTQGIKSTIAVHARYHAFRLAEGLSKLGVLDKVYTLNPRFKLKEYRVKSEEIRSFWWLGAAKYANLRLKLGFSDNAITSFFDDVVARTLTKPASKWVFTGYSGYSEKSLKRAKEMGAVTLVERGCPHIDHQEEFIRDEKSRLLKREIPLPKNEVRDRMVREYDLADYIVVPSRYSQKSFIDRGFSSSKVLVTPLCNEKHVELEGGRKTYPDTFTILSVSGHFYRKGLFYLLTAWKELQDEGLQNAKLIVRVDVPEEFKYLVSSPNLEVIGRHLPDREMNNLYNSASMFILPSVEEGFGMVVVEAMMAALPVVLTENVGAADIIQEGKEGFVIPIRDVQAIKEKILYFYHNRKDLERMGQEALETSKNYTPEKYGERMLGEYGRILDIKN